jgi:hypothetical protein
VLKIRLKEVLERHGLSAYRLAQSIKTLDEQTVFAYVRGSRTPSLNSLGEVLTALRELTGQPLTVSDILEYESPESYTRSIVNRDSVSENKQTTPTPIPIGPEGMIHTLTPMLRVFKDRDSQRYAFSLRDLSNNSFLIDNAETHEPHFIVPPNLLLNGASYVWTVRAYGQAGWSSHASPLTFMPLVQQSIHPERVSKLPPPTATHLFTETSTTTPTLKLEPVPDASTYGFYVRDLDRDAIIYDNDYASEAEVILPAGLLNPQGRYRWNARSRNVLGWSEFSERYYFTVSKHAVPTVPNRAAILEKLDGLPLSQNDPQIVTLLGQNFLPGSRVILTTPEQKTTEIAQGFTTYRGSGRLEITVQLNSPGAWQACVLTPDDLASNTITFFIT